LTNSFEDSIEIVIVFKLYSAHYLSENKRYIKIKKVNKVCEHIHICNNMKNILHLY